VLSFFAPFAVKLQYKFQENIETAKFTPTAPISWGSRDRRFKSCHSDQKRVQYYCWKA